MAERDPFGRLADENPLAFLGGSSNGTEAAAADAVAAEEAASAAQPTFAARPAVKPPRATDDVRTQSTNSLDSHVARVAGRSLGRAGSSRPRRATADASRLRRERPGLRPSRHARVRAGAPERLARSAAERLHRPASRVDYVVLVQSAGELSWSVFMRDGKHFVADAGGHITRRIG